MPARIRPFIGKVGGNLISPSVLRHGSGEGVADVDPCVECATQHDHAVLDVFEVLKVAAVRIGMQDCLRRRHVSAGLAQLLRSERQSVGQGAPEPPRM